MWRQGPSDGAHPAAEADDPDEDVIVRSPAQRSLVEDVDLSLDLLDMVQVPGQDLIGDGRIPHACVRSRASQIHHSASSLTFG